MTKGISGNVGHVVCAKGLEVEVLNSNAGYFLGTIVEQDFEYMVQNCRCTEYYKGYANANDVLQRVASGDYSDVRECANNKFCSGGHCFMSKLTKSLIESTRIVQVEELSDADMPDPKLKASLDPTNSWDYYEVVDDTNI